PRRRRSATPTTSRRPRRHPGGGGCLAELAILIDEVRLRAEAALLRRYNAGAAGTPIYLRDRGTLARVAGGTLRPLDSHRKAAAALDKVLASRDVDASSTRLGVMTARLGVDALAGGLLMVALGYAVDLDVRELCHALAPRRKPALYLEVCAEV